MKRTPAERDRRMVTLSLSTTGKQLAEQIIAIEQAFYAGIAASLGAAPLEKINETLWKFMAGRPTGEALIRRKAKL